MRKKQILSKYESIQNLKHVKILKPQGSKNNIFSTSTRNWNINALTSKGVPSGQ